ncbi:hypothetical protein D3C73_831390 [compost metagenome]
MALATASVLDSVSESTVTRKSLVAVTDPLRIVAVSTACPFGCPLLGRVTIPAFVTIAGLFDSQVMADPLAPSFGKSRLLTTAFKSSNIIPALSADTASASDTPLDFTISEDVRGRS